MSQFLGCLVFLLIGGLFFVFAALRTIFQTLFGGAPRHGASGTFGSFSQAGAQQRRSGGNAQSGNAHHERGGSRPNSRQRRSGKIFEKGEGRYVDFEDIPS